MAQCLYSYVGLWAISIYESWVKLLYIQHNCDELAALVLYVLLRNPVGSTFSTVLLVTRLNFPSKSCIIFIFTIFIDRHYQYWCYIPYYGTGIFCQCMGSVPIQHREKFGLILILAVTLVIVKNDRCVDRVTTRTGWMIFHLCLRTSGSEVRTRLADLGCIIIKI